MSTLALNSGGHHRLRAERIVTLLRKTLLVAAIMMESAIGALLAGKNRWAGIQNPRPARMSRNVVWPAEVADEVVEEGRIKGRICL